MNQEGLDNLFRILKLTGGKFVIVEDGQPRAVLMDYDEFQELVLPSATQKVMDKLKQIESVNEEIDRVQAKEIDVPESEAESDVWLNDADDEDEEIWLEPLDQF